MSRNFTLNFFDFFSSLVIFLIKLSVLPRLGCLYIGRRMSRRFTLNFLDFFSYSAIFSGRIRFLLAQALLDEGDVHNGPSSAA